MARRCLLTSHQEVSCRVAGDTRAHRNQARDAVEHGHCGTERLTPVYSMGQNNSEKKQQSKRYRLTKADQSKGGKKGGSAGGKKTAATYGPEYMKEIQSRGGRHNVERHGSDHMSNIGKKG